MNKNKYMRKLKDCFFEMPQKRERIEALRQELGQTLDKKQRLLLLELCDLEGVYCEEATLQSFLAGYRLAHGIEKELGEKPFDYLEDEQRLAKAFSSGS